MEMVAPEFITRVLQEKGILREGSRTRVREVEAQPMPGRGFVGTMSRLVLRWEGEEDGEALPTSLVLKTSGAGDLKLSLRYGMYREAFFYKELGEDESWHALPCLAATGSADTGAYSVLMRNMTEDGWTGVNLLFVNQCWGFPEGFERPAAAPSHLELVKHIFRTAAEIHRKHLETWAAEGVPSVPPIALSAPWIQFTDYVQGKGREEWEAKLAHTKNLWEEHAMKYRNVVSDKVSNVVTRSLQRSTFENMTAAVRAARCAAICHGDFHASNMFWKDGRILFCDWSHLMVACPQADLAQMLISDVPPSVWADPVVMRELLQTYHENLFSGYQGEVPPFSAAWDTFVMQGAAKWIYFFAVLVSFQVPEFFMGYLSQQLEAFLATFAPDTDSFQMVFLA